MFIKLIELKRVSLPAIIGMFLVCSTISYAHQAPSTDTNMGVAAGIANPKTSREKAMRAINHYVREAGKAFELKDGYLHSYGVSGSAIGYVDSTKPFILIKTLTSEDKTYGLLRLEVERLVKGSNEEVNGVLEYYCESTVILDSDCDGIPNKAFKNLIRTKHRRERKIVSCEMVDLDSALQKAAIQELYDNLIYCLFEYCQGPGSGKYIHLQHFLAPAHGVLSHP